MNTEDPTERDLLRLLVKHDPTKWGGLTGITQQVRQIRHSKKRFSYDIPDLSSLPEGQQRAIEALLSGGEARTYPQAARLAGMSLGSLLTHCNRIRKRHPALYAKIREVRLAQLADRHEDALAAARAHSEKHFRKRGKWLRQRLT